MNFPGCTLPETSSSPLKKKMASQKETSVFLPVIPRLPRHLVIPRLPRHPVIYPEVNGVLGYLRFVFVVFGVQIPNLSGVWMSRGMASCTSVHCLAGP